MAAVVLLVAVTILSDHQTNDDGTVCNHCKVCTVAQENQCLPDPFAMLLKKMMFMEKIPGRGDRDDDGDATQPCDEPEEGLIPVFPLPPGVKLSKEGILPYDCKMSQQDEFNGPPASPLHGIHKELPAFIIPLTLSGLALPTHYVPVFPKFGRRFNRRKRMLRRKKQFDEEEEDLDNDDLSQVPDDQRKKRREQSWREKCGKYRSGDWESEFDEDQEEGWSEEYDRDNEERLAKDKDLFAKNYTSEHSDATESDIDKAWKSKCGRQKHNAYKNRKTRAWTEEKDDYEKEVSCSPDTIEEEGEEVEDEDCYNNLSDDEEDSEKDSKFPFKMFYIPVLSKSRPRPSGATEYSHVISTQQVSSTKAATRDSCLLNSFSIVPANKQTDVTYIITGTPSSASESGTVELKLIQQADGEKQIPLIPVTKRPETTNLMKENFLFPMKKGSSGSSIMVIFPMPKRGRERPLIGFAPLFALSKDRTVCTKEEMIEMKNQKRKNYGMSRCCKRDEKPTCPELEDDEVEETQLPRIEMEAQLTLKMTLRQVVLNVAALTKKLLMIAMKTNRSDRITVLYACPQYSCPSGSCPDTVEQRASLGCVEFDLFGSPPRASIQSGSKTVVRFTVHSEVPGDVYQSIINEIEAAVKGNPSELSEFPVEELSIKEKDHHHHHGKKKIWCYIVVISIAIIAVSVAGLSIWCCCCKKPVQVTETTTIQVIHHSPVGGKTLDMDPVELRAFQKTAELDNEIPQGIVISTVPGMAGSPVNVSDA